MNQVPTTVRNLKLVGLVVKQFPTSNSMVKKGAVVTISIGQEAPGTSTGSGGIGGTGGTSGSGNTGTTTNDHLEHADYDQCPSTTT